MERPSNTALKRLRRAVVLLMAAALPAVTPSGSLSAQNPCSIRPEQIQTLRRELVAALGTRFDFVDGVVAESTSDTGCFWLARIRAREPGEFVIRYTVKYQ